MFVDCADENTSRDVEQSAGILGDNYYLQMVNYEIKTGNGFEKIGEASILFEKNQLMVSVPKTLIKADYGIDFKWAENYV